MYDSDRDELIATLRKHFTGSIEGDGELIWTKVKGMDLEDVIRSIQEHRLECGKTAYRPDIRRVVSMAIEYKNARNKSTSKKFKVIDWLRIFFCEKYISVPDSSAIMDHFANCWSHIKQEVGIDEYGRQMSRAYILAHARMAFRELGITESNGDKFARDIVELADGEIISGGRMFREIGMGKSAAEEIRRLFESENESESL
jgi:hypothetical protein